MDESLLSKRAFSSAVRAVCKLYFVMIKPEKPSLEVAMTTLLLIYSFQSRSAFRPIVPLSRLITCMHSRKRCFSRASFLPVTLNFDL